MQVITQQCAAALELLWVQAPLEVEVGGLRAEVGHQQCLSGARCH